MHRYFRWLAVGVLGAMLTFACSKSSGPNPPPPPPPPPTPANLTKEAGDAQNAEVGQAVAVAPAVKVTSSTGAAIQGVTVTFAVASGGGAVTGATPTTGADGIAAAGSWTLGANAGANTLTASISGSGVAGNPATFTATGELAAFDPTGNTSLSGTRSFTTVNIPAGVTVTATSDLVLNVTGTATIAGTLMGDCRNIEVNAEGELNVAGTVNNACAGGIPGTGPPTLTLVGKGGYNLSGAASTVASGDVTITDDPTATDADFAPPAAPSGAARRINRASAAVGVPCVVNAYTNTASPASAGDGASTGTTGGNGKDAATFTLRCKGGGDIVIGTISLTGQHGGTGGNGTDPANATAAVATGGDGGKGGRVRIQAVGAIRLGGGTINTGNGGAGGSATATGTGAGGNVGASATATGGNGAAPGLVAVSSRDASVSILGPLALNIGAAGRGGDATANAADGHNAPVCPPATGGPATATAGNGGTTPDKELRGSGSVSGLSNVTVTGGTPGDGGNAVAKSGKGGDGAQACKTGADGGDPRARGGDGGNGDLKNQAGVRIAAGGNGGTMEVQRALGGLGFIDCVLPYEAGGKGGMGGTARGANGTGGSGFSTGNPGAAIFNMVGNGGNGGNGLPPGAGGMEGSNSALLINVLATIIAPSFQPGQPGVACPGFSLTVTPPTQTAVQGATASVTVTIVRTGPFTGPVTLEIKDQDGTVRGTGTIAAGNTSTSVAFAVPGNEPTGTRTWSVMGMGADVPTQSATFGLDVSAPQTTTEVVLDLTSSNPPLVPGVVQPGTYTVGLQDAATMAVVGTIDLVAEGPSGQTFYGNDAPGGGPRVGWDGSLGSWLADLSSAIVNGAAWVFDTWEFCLLNSSVDASNPVVVEELDDMDMVTATTNVTSLTPCQNITLNKATKKVRKKKSGKGKFADGGGFRGKGKKKAP